MIRDSILTVLRGTLVAEKDHGAVLAFVLFGIFIGPADAKRRLYGSEELSKDFWYSGSATRVEVRERLESGTASFY